LTHLVDDKGQIRMSHRKILKTTNKTAILCSFVRGKNVTIASTEALSRRHRSSNWGTLLHTSTSKKIKSILASLPGDGVETSIPRK
jgi:hypothetical protein